MGGLVAAMIHLCHHTLFNPLILMRCFLFPSLTLVLGEDIGIQSSCVCFLEIGSCVAQAGLELVM